MMVLPNLSDTITVTINVRNVSVGNGDTEVAITVHQRLPMVRAPPAQWLRTQRQRRNIGDPVAARDVDRGDTLTYGLLSDDR